jgi:DNA-binding MarR family transcriptional regulator
MWTGPLDVTWATIRCGRQVERRLQRALEGRGIRSLEMEVLSVLEQRPNLHVGGLANVLRVPKQTVHRCVQHLTDRGIVELLPSHASRRGVFRTERASAFHESSLRSFDTIEQRLLRLDAADRQHLVRLLDRLDNVILRSW